MKFLISKNSPVFFCWFLGLVGVATSSWSQTNTNPPVFIGSTNLKGNVGQDFFYQVLIGGTGRDWVGSDYFTNASNSRWSTLKATNGGWVVTNNQLVLRSTSTNRSQPAQGEWAWQTRLPTNQSWVAYARVSVGTSLAATNGQSALAYLQCFQTNRPPGTLVYSNSSLVGWGRGLGLADSVSNQVYSASQFNNLPFATTNFSSASSGFYAVQNGTATRVSLGANLIFSNLGTASQPTNRLVYLASTNSLLFNPTNGFPSGTNGPGTSVAQPGLILPSTRSWEATTTVYLDSTKATSWQDPSSQGLQIGFCVAKNSSATAPLSKAGNRVSLDFLWQAGGGTVSRTAFSGGTNLVEAGFPWIYGWDPQPYSVKMKIAYDKDEKSLATYYLDPDFGWVKTDETNLSLDPEVSGSLGAAWNFTPGTDTFCLMLEADNDYSVLEGEQVLGSGNTIPGYQVPMYFSGLDVVLLPTDGVQAEEPGNLLSLILSYDSSDRSLTQVYAPDNGDYEVLSNSVTALTSWAANPLPQIRLGASAAQTNYPSNSIAVRQFSVIPGPGQIVYSLINSPVDLEIDPDLGTVTSSNLQTVGLTNFTVVASNPASGVTATQVFRLNIGSAIPRLAVATSTTSQYGITNSNILTVTVTNTNQLGTSPVTFSVNPSPSSYGLNVSTSSTSLTVRGTPTTAIGPTDLVISASNSAGVGTLTSSLSILPALPRLQLVQNRAFPQYSTNVANWSNAYWTVRVSNSLGQNPSAYPNLINVSNLPAGFSFRTLGAAVSTNATNATNTGIITLATNQATNVGVFSNVVFTVTNAAGSSTLTSTLTVLPSVPVLAVVTNGSGATNSGSASNPIFAGLAFGSSNSNWFQITNTTGAGFPASYVMQGAPQGLAINPSNGIVSGRVNQAVDATALFRAQNSSGPSAVLTVKISTLPPAPLFSFTTNYAPYATVSNVLVATITNTNQLGTNLSSVTWTTSATNAGTNGGFTVQTNSNRSQFIIRASANSTNAGVFSNLTVSSACRGATSTVTTNLGVLPATPALLAATNTNDPIQYGESITNALMVSVTNLARQNLADFPVTFTVTAVPSAGWTNLSNSGWLLVTNSTNAWLANLNPTLATNATVQFTASNAGGSVSTNLNLKVLPLPPIFYAIPGTNRLQYASGASTNYLRLEVDAPEAQNTNAGQFPVVWTISTNKPPGVGLNATSNLLTNYVGGSNPTQAGIFSNVVITASNAAGSYSSNVTLTVYPQLPQFRVVTNRVQINSNSTNAMIVQVTNTNASNALGLGVAGFGLSFTAFTNLPTGLDFISTNGGTNAVIGGIPTVATNASVVLVVSNLSGAATNTNNLSVLPAAPLISVASNGTFQYGVSNTNGFVITVTNAADQNTNDFPITFSPTNLSNGWTLTRTTGTNGVVGSTNPSAAISNTITVTVSNAGGSVSTNLLLRVLPGLVTYSSTNMNPSVRYLTNYPGGAALTSNVVQLVLVTNSQNQGIYPITNFSTNLPDGLSLTTSGSGNVRVIGTPTNAGIFTNVQIVSSNAAGAVTNAMTLTILPAAPLFSVTSNRTQYGVNSSNALVVTVTNTNAGAQNLGDFPMGFSVLPSLSGLAFTNTNGYVGTYGGTNPAVVTNATLTVVVTNAGGATTNTNVSLAVLPALPLFTVTNNRTQYGANSSNALVVTVTNTAGQNTNAGQFTNFTFSSPSLPLGGIAFTNTNGLTGTAGSANPTVATNATITVVVSNAAGATTNTNVSLQVLPAAPLFSVTSNRTQYGVNSSNALVVTVTNTAGQNTNDFPDFGFSVLPSLSGLAFTNTNGYVGTYGGTNPAVVTNATLTVVVTNAGGATTNTNVSLAVLPGVPALSVVTNGTIQFGVSNTNAIVVTVTNGDGQNTSIYPLTFSSSNLPTNFGWGLTKVGETNGVLGSANPTLATNVTNLLITVTNAGGSASTNLVLRVLPLKPTNFTFATNSIRAGQAVDYRVGIATNGQNTNDFPITFGGTVLPTGLNLGTNGSMSGTATVAATFQSVFTAENAAGLGTNTNAITVLGGAPEIVGTNKISFTGSNSLTTNTYFRYQISARGVGQNWAGRSDFLGNTNLSSTWLTNDMTNADAALSADTEPGYLDYTWTNTIQTFAYLEWNQPLPSDSGWLASVAVNFRSNAAVTNLAGLNLMTNDYLGGMLAAYPDAAVDSDWIGSFFGGDSSNLDGATTAFAVTDTNDVTNGILTNTSTVSMGWIGLRLTNLGGTNKIQALGNPGVTNANSVWSTNYTMAVNTAVWTNAARSNSLVLRLSGESQAPLSTDFAFQFSEFVVVPLGDLTYSSTNLPAGLTVDPASGLITGVLPATPLTKTSTISIFNSAGTNTLTIEFDIQ